MNERDVPGPLRVAAGISWRILVIVAAIAVLALALGTLRIILLPTVVALLLATLFQPPVDLLRRYGAPSAIATLLVLFGIVAGTATTITLSAPYLASEAAELGELQERVREGVDLTVEWAVEGPLDLTEGQVRDLVDQAEQQLRDLAPQLVGGAVSGALVLIEVLIGGVLAVVLLFFFLHDGRGMWDWVTRLFPKDRRADVDEMGRRVWTALSRYLRAQVVVALVDAVLIGALLVILDIPLAIPLAILIFFGGFVPIVGAFVTGFLAVMVALASEGFVIALIVLGWTALVQQLEGNVLEPYIVGRYVRLHPAAIVLAITAGSVVWGIPGAFIAAPLLATVSAAGAYVSERNSESSDEPAHSERSDPGDEERADE